MVATADCEDAPKHVGGKKVSKPLMEKKRRARINKCLDQLKLLLENYYSTSIRKRKLEKADILELTVNHLRSLQKSQSCASDLCDYQRGFRRCLAHVDQYVMVTDAVMLSQLSSKLGRSRREGGGISTTDSGPGAPHHHHQQQRRIQPKAHDGTEDPDVDALSRSPAEETRPGSVRVHVDAGARKTDPGDADRSEGASVAHMWRPW